MKPIDTALQCPGCHGPLAPKVLGCENCNLKVEGPFTLNEFATLPAEDLHFLRIFVRCEGRIRDMEPALGLSYPTIRARLTQLKNQLAPMTETPQGAPAEPSTQNILQQLESGKIEFEEAMQQIKRARKPKGSKK